MYSLVNTGTKEELVVAANMTPTAAYWGGSQSTVWNTVNGSSTNWLNGLAGTDTNQIPGSTTDVYFTATSATRYTSTTLGQDFTIAGLFFTGTSTSDASGPITIGGGTHTLTIMGDGISMATGAAPTTIVDAVKLVRQPELEPGQRHDLDRQRHRLREHEWHRAYG